MRCINVVNFIRGVEPRGPVDLMAPVRGQMELIRRYELPATWLLQFDALVSGPFVPFLKEQMRPDHEVGIWFEMNQEHCKAAEVKWRGRPGYEWDWSPPVAFTLGYTIEERERLVDAAVEKFAQIWGRKPKSVASWNLDALTMARFAEHHGVDAFAVCRDQIATDGFTIWGAPIAGYYPSRVNAWSPALDREHQISTPVFRMLGQDPVYYYDNLPQPGQSMTPDTMEPVWPSGRSPTFVKRFLEMISDGPAGEFSYAQLGQENSFGWPDMREGYELQMPALAALRKTGKVHVETMSESGRRFKRWFAETPVQVQSMLEDPFGRSDASRTVWYQSRFYRANLHFAEGEVFFRDITVYSDLLEQPHLREPATLHDQDQRLPAVLDGYHWRGRGSLLVGGEPARLAGKPLARQVGRELFVNLTLQGGEELAVVFRESGFLIRGECELRFEWEPALSTFKGLSGNWAWYAYEGLDYSVRVVTGRAKLGDNGWKVVGSGLIELDLEQRS